MKTKELPFLWEKEWYRNLCRKENISPEDAVIDLAHEVIDGKVYAGPEIGERYACILNEMSFPQKAEYAAKARGFAKSDRNEFIEMVGTDPGYADIYRKTSTEYLIDTIITYNSFIVAYRTSIALYCIADYEEGKHVERESDVFTGDDVFRHLNMMNGDYKAPHQLF